MSKKPVIVNFDLAKNVLRLVNYGLNGGLGGIFVADFGNEKPWRGQMCVEQAVVLAEGGDPENNDRPRCVIESVRTFKIALNDASWSSNEARAKGLRRIAIAQLGTKSNVTNLQFIRAVKEIIFELAFPRIAADLLSEKLPKGIRTRIKKMQSGEYKLNQKNINKLYDLIESEVQDSYDLAGMGELQELTDFAIDRWEGKTLCDWLIENTDVLDFTKKSKDKQLRFVADVCELALLRCESPGIAFLDKLLPRK